MNPMASAIIGAALILLWMFTGADRDSTLMIGLYFLLLSRLEDMEPRV